MRDTEQSCNSGEQSDQIQLCLLPFLLKRQLARELYGLVSCDYAVPVLNLLARDGISV